MKKLLFGLSLALASLIAAMEIPGFYGENESHPVPCSDCRATGVCSFCEGKQPGMQLCGMCNRTGVCPTCKGQKYVMKSRMH
jgi:DnaJ-class molecular chaperone